MVEGIRRHLNDASNNHLLSWALARLKDLTALYRSQPKFDYGNDMSAFASMQTIAYVSALVVGGREEFVTLGAYMRTTPSQWVRVDVAAGEIECIVVEPDFIGYVRGNGETGVLEWEKAELFAEYVEANVSFESLILSQI